MDRLKLCKENIEDYILKPELKSTDYKPQFKVCLDVETGEG